MSLNPVQAANLTIINTSQSVESATSPLGECLVSQFFTTGLWKLMIYSTVSSELEHIWKVGQTKCEKQPLVLAVDDDRDNLELMSEILDFFGCSCLGALDGKTTLTAIRNHHPDLILLDIRLPDIDGIELIYHIKEDPKLVNIPIIAVTSLAKPEDRDRILLAGCVDYICKPFNLDTIEITIRRHLR